jgi:hypothetical protein
MELSRLNKVERDTWKIVDEALGDKWTRNQAHEDNKQDKVQNGVANNAPPAEL